MNQITTEREEAAYKIIGALGVPGTSRDEVILIIDTFARLEKMGLGVEDIKEKVEGLPLPHGLLNIPTFFTTSVYLIYKGVFDVLLEDELITKEEYAKAFSQNSPEPDVNDTITWNNPMDDIDLDDFIANEGSVRIDTAKAVKVWLTSFDLTDDEEKMTRMAARIESTDPDLEYETERDNALSHGDNQD